MTFKIKKLSSAGVAHHALIAILVISSFAGFGAWRVFNSSAATNNTTNPQTQKIVSNDGCEPGYAKKDGKCVKLQQADRIKAECDSSNTIYDAGTNSCKQACKQGFYLKDGACTEIKSEQPANSNLTPAPSGSNNTGGGNQDTTLSVEKSCTDQHRIYNKAQNKCDDNCMAGWYKKDGKLPCLELKNSPTPADGVKTGPANPQTDQCGTAGNPKCIAPTPTPADGVKTGPANPQTDQCGTNIDTANPRCVAPTETDGVKVAPNGTIRTDVCKADAAKCIAQANQTKAECDALFLLFDKDAKKCKTECKKGYVRKEGTCLDKAEALETMTERLCRALGRDWIIATTTTAAACDSDPQSACLDETAAYVAADSNTRAYCTGGSLSVDTKVSKDDCIAQNRLFLEAAQVCSARCKTGFYLKDGTCKELATNDSADQSNGDGEGEEGGCLLGVQPKTSGACDEDEPVGQLEPDVLKLDKNIGPEACALMGREYDKTKDENKKIIKGCNVEKCVKNNVDVINPENGKPFCQGYIAKIDQQTCNDLHRVWVAEAKGCSARIVQDKKPGTTIAKSAQCSGEFSTYVYKTDGPDECLKPSNVQKLQGIAKSTGTPFVKLTDLSRAALCNIQLKKHWNGERCVKDKPADHGTRGGAPVSNPGTQTSESTNPTGSDTSTSGGQSSNNQSSGNQSDREACEARGDRYVGDECYKSSGSSGAVSSTLTISCENYAAMLNIKLSCPFGEPKVTCVGGGATQLSRIVGSTKFITYAC